MDILNLTKNFITKNRDKTYKRSKPLNEDSYKRGWRDAIAFAKKVNSAYATCEQCGKLITSESDYNIDCEGILFCNKCWDKLFPIKREGD